MNIDGLNNGIRGTWSVLLYRTESSFTLVINIGGVKKVWGRGVKEKDGGGEFH
jgi:hypothetical protein